MQKEQLLPELKQDWDFLTAKYKGGPSYKDELFRKIAEEYTGPERHYHSLEHIACMLRLTRQHEGRLHRPDVVRCAVFYHDLVYVPGRRDNERRSANLAAEALHGLGADIATITTVSEFILASANHLGYQGGNRDLEYFLDFDLSILAAPREEYQLYAKKVRMEFRQVPGFLYRQGRGSFLKQMLKQPQLFFTPEFKEGVKAARENMHWELEEGLLNS